MTIKCNLLLLHQCVLPGQGQAAGHGSGRGDAGASRASLPVAPQGDDPCPGHAGQEVALLFVIVPRVLLQHRSLAWVSPAQCQVIGLSNVLLQPNSLLQNPFSNPVPCQVQFSARNECIEDGWAGWNQLVSQVWPGGLEGG